MLDATSSGGPGAIMKVLTCSTCLKDRGVINGVLLAGTRGLHGSAKVAVYGLGIAISLKRFSYKGERGR